MRAKRWLAAIAGLVLVLCFFSLVFWVRAETMSPGSTQSPVAVLFNYLPLINRQELPKPATATPRPTATGIPGKTPTATTPPRTGDGMIADHQAVADFLSIPESAVKQAAQFKTLFMHQSTGGYISSIGLSCLQGVPNFGDPPEAAECLTYPQYYYDPRNWDWKEWPTPMADAAAKADQWVSIATAEARNFDVLGMKFCYVDGWNQNFDNYRTEMEALEKQFPDKIWIWSTSVLWSRDAVVNGGTSAMSYEAIHLFNQQLREYAIAHNKPLYDLAAIESHDSNGNLCQANGVEVLCDEYSTGLFSGGGGHPNYLGSVRMAKGFWWLMARISGWDGN